MYRALSVPGRAQLETNPEKTNSPVTEMKEFTCEKQNRLFEIKRGKLLKRFNIGIANN